VTPPIGQPLVLAHAVLPAAGRVWGAGRPSYPDEPPAPGTVELGVRDWRAAGVDLVVSLIEDWEVPRRAPGLFETLGRHGITLVRFPVPDFGVPADAAAFARLLAEVRGRLGEGGGVLAHCNAGLGRTAVFLGALLRASGFGGDPVAEIRRVYRPNAMERDIQEAFVRGFPVLDSRPATPTTHP
jgi:protein-tyrosine phosphatase